MIDFVYSLMTDKRKGVVFFPLKFILYLTSLIYGLAILLRRILYKLRIFSTRKAPLKIISVGNITLGGTGKTPFTMALARLLEEELKRSISILIRGYGWDEQEMLKRNLADVPVLVGQDRFRSSNKAVRLYGSDTAILDDGFQHWELVRDMDIVLIDLRNPFGNGHLFPRGILREPKRSLVRADVIVLTKNNSISVGIDAIGKEVRAINDKALILEAAHVPKYLYEGRARRVHDLSTIRTKRVVLLSSIGDPLYFEETIKALGADVIEHIKFPDHHDYTKKDIDRVTARCDGRQFDLVITTEKDIVKLNRLGLFIGSHKVLTLTVEMQILSGRENLIDRLHSLYTR